MRSIGLTNYVRLRNWPHIAYNEYTKFMNKCEVMENIQSKEYNIVILGFMEFL
ncbi:MAG: hypothetical protein K0R09_802 [Clostridiales bacterium]|jgi:hypothetical protein|nr:hypothetical protein [Clostridiales bacterium]